MREGRYRLYGRHGSGSDVVRMLLEEIAAPYEFVAIGREPADVRAYREQAGTDRVPALVLPQGSTMIESAAICIHLAAAHPAARLGPPAGSAEHARFLQWMVYLSANLYDCALRIYYSARYSRDGERAAAGIKQQATDEFSQVVGQIVPALAPYVLGSEISAVDHYLYMLGSWHPDGREPLHARWPSLARHSALLAARPAVRTVDALVQSTPTS